MKVSQVANLSTEDRFLYWIRERQAILHRRQAGKLKPWTDDEILQSYRFCNVIRIDDKVSQWLLNNWYLPYKDHRHMVLACVLARQLNTPEALAEVGFPEVWQPHCTQKVLESRANKGLHNYSAAYMITGRYGGRGRAKESKPYQTVWRVCHPIYDSLPYMKLNTNSMRETWFSLLGRPGLGSFMAGQVVADLRWALSGTWEDKNRWAPVGPGSSRGLCRYLGRPLENRFTQKEFDLVFTALFFSLQNRPGIPKMEAMDFQSSLCEWDKYERVLQGEGRPKQRYPGV